MEVYGKLFRIDTSQHFAGEEIHINGIEAFLTFTKRRLAKFNGVKKNFELLLKNVSDASTIRQICWSRNCNI